MVKRQPTTGTVFGFPQGSNMPTTFTVALSGATSSTVAVMPDRVAPTPTNSMPGASRSFAPRSSVSR